MLEFLDLESEAAHSDVERLTFEVVDAGWNLQGRQIFLKHSSNSASRHAPPNAAEPSHSAVSRKLQRLGTPLLDDTGADLAHYRAESVVSGLRAGTIRTGDLYNLESWRETVTVVSIKGDNLSPQLAATLRSRGDSIQSKSTYSVATTSYVADEFAAELLGSAESKKTSKEMLRDVAIAHLQSNGFPA